MVSIVFRGVRGSVPTPISAREVMKKIGFALLGFRESGQEFDAFINSQPFYVKGTYGGNTSCVELNFDGTRVVLDMGTGLRELGNPLLIQEMIANQGLSICFCLSHVHWDHIQGLPFFTPFYANKYRGIKNHWTFYGGTDWQRRAELCLRGQMDPPTFPVSWDEIRSTTERMDFHNVCDSFQFEIGAVKVKTRKLNHPQETYGYRFEYRGLVIVYTTDNEPYDPREPDPRLLELAQGADVWITDCQYDQETYNGQRGGVPRHGWGHSYDIAVAETACRAKTKHVVLFHHDPVSSDEKIWQMEGEVRQLIKEGGGEAEVTAASEILEISFR